VAAAAPPSQAGCAAAAGVVFDAVDAVEDEDESLPRQKNTTMASTAAAAMTTPSTSELEFDLAGGGACLSAEERSFAEDFLPMEDHSNPGLQWELHGLAHSPAPNLPKAPPDWSARAQRPWRP